VTHFSGCVSWPRCRGGPEHEHPRGRLLVATGERSLVGAIPERCSASGTVTEDRRGQHGASARGLRAGAGTIRAPRAPPEAKRRGAGSVPEFRRAAKRAFFRARPKVQVVPPGSLQLTSGRSLEGERPLKRVQMQGHAIR
jgi:hypothetical protein